MKDLAELLSSKSKTNSADRDIYVPTFFKMNNAAGRRNLSELLEEKPHIKVSDSIYSQLRELVKLNHPGKKLSETEIEELLIKHIGSTPLWEYGVWVYYPWNDKLVHILDEEEFIILRTNRNKYKITEQEQQQLKTKKIGVIGLSVGQSIALTLVMERVCGEIKLADFDVAELTNLNRIRTGLTNLEINKAIITAREISEIDPYIKVEVFPSGVTAENMKSFFEEKEKIDLLVEVCDGLDIKIEARIKARELKIPVVMDTNDRGMIDIERFDIEHDRPILHGLVGEIDSNSLKTLSNEEKIPMIVRIASARDASTRGKASMIEVGQSISSWPQLASSVVLGGGVIADVCRRILLNQLTVSGRFYVDPEDIIKNPNSDLEKLITPNPYRPLSKEKIEELIRKASTDIIPKSDYVLKGNEPEDILNAAIAAPSTGNDQPWKFSFKDNVLYVFHDKISSYSFGDFKNIASYLTFGAVYENIFLKAAELGLDAQGHLYPLGEDSELVLAFRFSRNTKPSIYYELASYIPRRYTDRNIEPYQAIENSILERLKETAKSIAGAELKFLTEKGCINKIGEVIGACDRLRILNTAGHNDFVNREMRWDPTVSEDGISVRSLGLSESQITALEIIKDSNVINFLCSIKGGQLLKTATVKSIEVSSAIGLITMPGVSAYDYVFGGRAMERVWLEAVKNNLSVHPVISPLYLFPRLNYELEETGLSQEEINEVRVLRKKFVEIFNLREGLGEVFLFKLFVPNKPPLKTPRKPLEKVLVKV